MKLALSERLAKGSVVGPTGCRLWTKTANKAGYGRMMYRRVTYQTHRLAWAVAHGPIPDGLCVLHRCDVPACINPDHLFLGTSADNNRDRHAKGRNNSHLRRGEANGWAKLTTEKVRAILVDTRTHKRVAADFGVSESTVDMIKTRRRWAHISLKEQNT